MLYVQDYSCVLVLGNENSGDKIESLPTPEDIVDIEDNSLNASTRFLTFKVSTTITEFADVILVEPTEEMARRQTLYHVEFGQKEKGKA